MLDSMIAKCGTLATSLGKIGGITGTVSSGMSKVSNSMSKATKSTKSLSSAFGSFYANYFWVIRGIKSLNKSIEGTADYVEAFNYFEVSFNKIASEWKQDYEKFGYDNAEAYAESFAERAKASMAKLSGVQIDVDANGNGLLTETGMKNLGLNIQTITQYASQLASVTNSVGQTGEVSLRTSTAFTKLAGDISSLFNVDYSSVATNLQSGLIGQSRALYKYGIDITNATLQTYAYELGLEKAVSEMTQAEKMQLRMIAILDQSKVSWGDLANTINSPSNMLRQFANNAKEAGMILGQLFVPLLSKVLPVVNGGTIAIKRLLANIAGILGIKLDLSSFGQGASDLGDSYEDISEGLDDVASSAEKAKAGVRAFDELKTINMPDTSSSGASGGAGGSVDLTGEIIAATEEYERVWQEAYDKMEQRAQAFADTFEKKFKPIEKLFQDIAIGDWFAVGQDVSNIVSGIFNFFADAIADVDWYGLGNNIGLFLEGVDWTQILSSVGRFIWEGINGSLELWEGIFEAAPIETALVSLFLMPKLLKMITGSGNVSGVKKLATNISLLATSLMGNQKSIKTLTKSYPKLGSVVNVARKAFANFRFGIENGNFLTGMSEGLITVRNNLTGLQKGLIGISAGFIEFSVIKDSVEDLVNGTGSLSANIVELGLAIAGAGAAFTLVFGFPAGLIATAIVGVIGAIAGITTAMNEIHAEKVGQSIKDAFENPGGVPISEVVGKVASSIMAVGDSFDSINEKSQELETTNKNIESIWLEIEKIEKSMDAGVLSVEEGNAELSRLFGELADTASEKFDLLETTLLSAYGENGALAKTMERLGITTEGTTNTILQLNDKVEQRVKELTTLLANIDPTSPKYTEYRLELSKLIGTTDEVSQAISDFEFKVGSTNIDYSGLLADEELDETKVTNYLTDITNAITTADTDIENGILGVKASLTEELSAAVAIGDVVKAEEIQAQLDVLPDALSLLQEDVRVQGTAVANDMQLYFVNQIDSVISEAKTDWENMKWYERLFSFCDNADEYALKSVDRYKKDYIKPLSEEIEKQYSELGINGAGWADRASTMIINSLFDSMTTTSESGIVTTTYSLREDYETILNDSTDGLSALMEEKGKDTVDGYNQGISENASSSEKETKTWIQKVVEKVRSVLDSHSPSRVFKTIGKDTVDGFNEGIQNNQSKSITTASSFVNNIVKQFSSLENKTYSIGGNVTDGLKNGLTSKAQSLYDSAKKIADNIAKTMKNALDIHSPSRVMFEIGGFTMQGFDEGLEQWRKPILESVASFGKQFEIANMDLLQTDYQYPTLQYETPTDFRQILGESYLQRANSNADNSETNTLLRELISAVKNGNVITIDGREVGRTVQKENQEYYLRTGRGLLDV